MHKIQITCQCCNSTTSIHFVEDVVDPDSEENDVSVENYPEYCPMCGNHCSEEGDIDEE